MKSPPLAAVLLLLPATLTLAQPNEGNVGVMPDRFTHHNWAQIRPDFGYLNGCATGYRAFSFGKDGYFVFNRNIHGSWRLTPQGNLVLRTRAGQNIMLLVTGSTLAYPPRNTATVQEEEVPIPPGETAPSGNYAETAKAKPIAPGLPAPQVEGVASGGAASTPPPRVAVNPPYESVASGYLRFRGGDLFQECGE